MTFDVEVLPSLPSTQDELRDRLAKGLPCPHALIALDQTQGRGRRQRTWVSEPGSSLTMSLALPEWRSHTRPWLPGMASAVAVAQALDAQIQWPNDVVMNGRKVAGILVEQHPVKGGGLQPVVGIGVNLRQGSFPPEISHRATSFLLETGRELDPSEAAWMILSRLEPLRHVRNWGDIAGEWLPRDLTPGKIYRTAAGETAKGLGIGPHGELEADISGRREMILAAEAFFEEERPA
jgi:BirA family transcriptional regulator, biotin operon repressor / biotin---[acetyl-CoA-carboxylase] ligase